MKNYTFDNTSNPDIKRVVDSEGNWEWYFHVPTKRYLRGVTSVLDRGYAKGKQFYEYLKNGTPEEIDRKLSEAGDRGDAVHQFVSKIFETGKADRTMTVLAEDNKTERTLTNKEWFMVSSFVWFWNAHAPKLINYEQVVFDLQHGFAGTYDFIARITKSCGIKSCMCLNFVNKLGLIDLKTGGGIYTSYEAQIASYASTMPEIEYTAVLRVGTKHITTKGCEFKAWNREETNLNFNLFLASLKIAEKEWDMFDETKIQEIPDMLEIKVERESLPTIIPMGEATELTGKDLERAVKILRRMANEKPKRKIIRKKNAKISKN